MVWAKKDGGELLQIVTARYQSTAIVLSLLVSAEIGTFFSPSRVVSEVRVALREDATHTLEFWTGIVLMISIFFSVAALLANFTAWSIFSGLSKQNAPIILRSSIGKTDFQMKCSYELHDLVSVSLNLPFYFYTVYRSLCSSTTESTRRCHFLPLFCLDW